jgi:hypothetical protein
MSLDQIHRLASEVISSLRSARQSQEMIRMKYVNLGDFRGTDPVVDSWVFEVAGPFEGMKPLIPILKKHGFRWDSADRTWRLDATNYAYSNRKRDNLWNWARRNQEAAYKILKPLVEKHNQEAMRRNDSMRADVPQTPKEVMQFVSRTERLHQRLKEHGIEVKFEFPDRYSVAESKAWVLGNTYPIKDVMKRFGFRWGRGKHGQGWWVPANEYPIIMKKWMVEVFKALPDLADTSDTGNTPFSDMSRGELLRWIKQNNVVEDDMRMNEWYDGERTDQEVLRQYLDAMPKWPADKQREVFDRGSIVPPGYRYGASKTAVHPSWVARTLMKAEADLTRRAQNYTGDREHTRARVEVNPKGWPIIHVWLQMQGDEGRPEAQELADLLLGQGATVSRHKLVADLWIAEAVYQPR